jgi:hypothetical protein
LLSRKKSKRPNLGPKIFEFFAHYAKFGPERGGYGKFFWFCLAQNFITNMIGQLNLHVSPQGLNWSPKMVTYGNFRK